MSGIEAAGLIVGVIPIVIWGLENYKITRNIWYRSRNKALLVDRLINALREQQVLIELDLQILLRAADCEDYETAFAEGSSCYDFLRDQQLAQPFAQYLGRAYEPYRNALGRCEQILTDLAQSIGGLMPQIPSPDAYESYLVELINTHASPTAPSRWRQTNQKIKFALKKEELDRKISELDVSTSMLSRLRVAGGALQDDDQPTASSRRIAKLSHFLSKVQRYTSCLYFAIANGCSTSCHPLHRFKLYLENWSAPLLRKKPQILFRIESLPVSAPAELKVWCSAHVEALAEDEEEEEQTKPTMGQGHHFRSHKVPTVAFKLPQLDPPRKDQVQDLCAVLTGTPSKDKPLKLYLSERGSLSSCYQLPKPQSQDCRSHSPAGTVTLESIIQKAHESREYSMRWTLNQRMLLAYRLASSLLQFHSTLWLRGSWNKRSICFSHNGPPNTSDSHAFSFDADSPFIIHDFHPSPAPNSDHRPNAKAALLDQGILLLEIWHLTPFELYAAQEKLHLDNTYGASICEGLIKPLWDNCVSKAK
ncbi:MAG: hypothetical protein Q9208_000246 [Pyrenodesmia sp. 3 TL-2023]